MNSYSTGTCMHELSWVHGSWYLSVNTLIIIRSIYHLSMTLHVDNIREPFQTCLQNSLESQLPGRTGGHGLRHFGLGGGCWHETLHSCPLREDWQGVGAPCPDPKSNHRLSQTHNPKRSKTLQNNHHQSPSITLNISLHITPHISRSKCQENGQTDRRGYFQPAFKSSNSHGKSWQQVALT